MSVPTLPPVPRVDVILSLATPSGDACVVDLATRALVVAVVPPPRWGREAEVLAGVGAAATAGADLVEVPPEPRLIGPAAIEGGLPVAVRVATIGAARAAADAGAALVLVPAAPLDDLLAAAGGRATATTPTGGSSEPPADLLTSTADRATTTNGDGPGGRPADGLDVPVLPVVDTAHEGRDAVEGNPRRPVALDVTRMAGADAVSEEALALTVGVRVIRTGDVRRTRRVVEVMAHLLEARR